MENTTNTQEVSIETLAERLNGNLWIKGDMKRIYLDRGYTTKKMTTKTYVYQREDGTFGVSCNIECPSQAWQWIKSQQEEVIEGVECEIENALSTEVFILTNSNDEIVNWEGLPRALNNATHFLNEKEAKKDFGSHQTKFIVMDRVEFETKVAAMDKIDAENELLNSPKAILPQPSIEAPVMEKSPSRKKTSTPTYNEGLKVSHSKFGLGTVLMESESIVQIEFESGDKKEFVKQFVKLEILS